MCLTAKTHASFLWLTSRRRSDVAGGWSGAEAASENSEVCGKLGMWWHHPFANKKCGDGLSACFGAVCGMRSVRSFARVRVQHSHMSAPAVVASRRAAPLLLARTTKTRSWRLRTVCAGGFVNTYESSDLS